MTQYEKPWRILPPRLILEQDHVGLSRTPLESLKSGTVDRAAQDYVEGRARLRALIRTGRANPQVLR